MLPNFTAEQIERARELDRMEKRAKSLAWAFGGIHGPKHEDSSSELDSSSKHKDSEDDRQREKLRHEYLGWMFGGVHIDNDNGDWTKLSPAENDAMRTKLSQDQKPTDDQVKELIQGVRLKWCYITTDKGMENVCVVEDSGAANNWISDVQRKRFGLVAKRGLKNTVTTFTGETFSSDEYVDVHWMGKASHEGFARFYIAPQNTPLEILVGQAFIEKYPGVLMDQEPTPQLLTLQSTVQADEQRQTAVEVKGMKDQASMSERRKHPSPPLAPSSTPLTTTTTENDASEAFSRQLLRFRDLQHLWPQLLHRCGSRSMSLTTVEEMLMRFSEDISKLSATMDKPDSTVCLAASQFVRKSRFNIARRIWEAYRDGPDDQGETGNKSPDRGNADKVEDYNDKDFVYEDLESFIFKKRPILAFEANVKAFVGFQHADDSGIANRLYRFAEVCFSNFRSIIHERPLELGKQRVRWRCKCGMKLHDDYIELQQGAVRRLEQLLEEYFSSTSEPDEAVGPSVTPDAPSQGGTGSWGSSLLSKFRLPNNRASTLPRHHSSSRSDEELGTCPVTPETPHLDHNFVLLCVPFSRLASKLWQAEICRINSDREFFRVLRYYYGNHGKRPWARLRKVQAVHFVKFEMYQSLLVDIQECPDVPSEAQAYNTYSFDPIPAETNPPIGSNLLTHLLEHPEDAEILPVLFRKVPKKLRAKLQACPKKGSAVGWGIQIVEGLNWFTVSLCGCSGFAAALLSAVIWSVVRSDVQGGFAIAGFMTAFLGFCLGIVRSEIQVA